MNVFLFLSTALFILSASADDREFQAEGLLYVNNQGTFEIVTEVNGEGSGWEKSYIIDFDYPDQRLAPGLKKWLLDTLIAGVKLEMIPKLKNIQGLVASSGRVVEVNTHSRTKQSDWVKLDLKDENDKTDFEIMKRNVAKLTLSKCEGAVIGL